VTNKLTTNNRKKTNSEKINLRMNHFSGCQRLREFENHQTTVVNFLATRRSYKRVICCPSICSSQSLVTPKRLKISTYPLHHAIEWCV